MFKFLNIFKKHQEDEIDWGLSEKPSWVPPVEEEKDDFNIIANDIITKLDEIRKIIDERNNEQQSNKNL